MKPLPKPLVGAIALFAGASSLAANVIAFDPFDANSTSGGGPDPENGVYWSQVSVSTDGNIAGEGNRATRNGGIRGFGVHPWDSNVTTFRPQTATLETANRAAGNGAVRVLSFRNSPSGAPSMTHRAAWRDLDPYTPSSTYYMSGVLQAFTDTTNAPGGFMLIGFGNDLISEADAMADVSNDLLEGILWGFRANETGERLNIVVRATTDREEKQIQDFVVLEGVEQLRNYFVALRVDINETGKDTITVWVDPLPSMLGEDPPGGITFQADAFSSASSISRFAMIQSGLRHSGTIGSTNRVGYLDAPTLGTTYTSIADAPTAFYQPFGSAAGRAPGDIFEKSQPAEWTLQSNALRVTAASADYEASFATAPMSVYTVGDDFGLQSRLTLASLADTPAENGVGHVLLASADGFDATSSSGFYTTQWLPNSSTGSRLVIREGSNGTILAEAPWTGLHPSETTPGEGIGSAYTLTSLGRHQQDGSLALTFKVADATGHSARVTATVFNPAEGTRFGFGARHRSAENAAWAFHDLGMTEPWRVDYQPTAAPFSYAFGSSAGRDNLDDLLLAHPRPGGWSLTSGAVRFEPTTGAWDSSVSAVSVSNYHAGQDFTLEVEMTLQQLLNLGLNRLGLAVLGSDHDPYNFPFNPEDDSSYYGLMWIPNDSGVSEIRIRNGFNGSNLVTAVWNGMYPKASNPNEGIGTPFQMTATGTYDENGALTLSYTLTDSNGYSQTISAEIAAPRHGTTFGVGGRIAGGQHPIADFSTLSMELGEPPVSEGSRYADWVAEHFDSSQQADPSISGIDASPAGDGVSNLMKYLLDLSPWTAIPASETMVTGFDNGDLLLTYWERPEAEDIGYEIELSYDLIDWETSSGQIQEVSRTTNNEFDTVTVRAMLPEDAERAFIRLRLRLLE